MKIFHTADIQVNIGGRHFSRKLEYEYMLNVMYESFKSNNYDILVIVGDLFERYLANETEKTVLVEKLIRPVLNLDKLVVIVDGNHDLKQSNFTFDPGDGSEVDEVNVLKALHTYVNHPNLHYFEDTGFYKVGNLLFAVWSHKSKYSSTDMPYNPWYKLSQATAQEQQIISCQLYRNQYLRNNANLDDLRKYAMP
jgi:DNA repair exonuclease SbcCD nuclease subunit